MSSEKILIVDDEEHILELLDAELKSAGYEVIKAQGAEEAIAKAETFFPGLIIMDIMMPEMNGAEAVKALDNIPKTKDIPIIFMTAMITKDEEIQEHLGVNIGGRMQGVIAKPIDREELLAKVKKVFMP